MTVDDDRQQLLRSMRDLRDLAAWCRDQYAKIALHLAAAISRLSWRDDDASWTRSQITAVNEARIVREVASETLRRLEEIRLGLERYYRNSRSGGNR